MNYQQLASDLWANARIYAIDGGNKLDAEKHTQRLAREIERLVDACVGKASEVYAKSVRDEMNSIRMEYTRDSQRLTKIRAEIAQAQHSLAQINETIKERKKELQTLKTTKKRTMKKRPQLASHKDIRE